jgi:BirA family transcriptional regulator, biotin operon repressor / biotin---[acetyl-CoA-carboxylase] ligase
MVLSGASVVDRDELVADRIKDETPAIAWDTLDVSCYREIASTNDEALQCARLGAMHGTLIVAESQTQGRGRKGRRWISPAGPGLYFSLVLLPRQPLENWPLLTHVASIALARTLQRLPEEGIIARPLDLELKWPNDVLISGKKAAGILLETGGAGGRITAAIVGVGVNVGKVELPAELEDQVTSIGAAAGVAVPRRHILVRFLYHFQLGYDLFSRGQTAAILDEWKSFSRMWTDTPVWIAEDERSRPAVTRGLSKTGALIVQTPDGAEETILAGDVSIRRRYQEER